MIKDTQISHFITLIKRINHRKQLQLKLNKSVPRDSGRYISQSPQTSQVQIKRSLRKDEPASQIFHKKTIPKAMTNIPEFQLDLDKCEGQKRNMFREYCRQISHRKNSQANQRRMKTQSDSSMIHNYLNETFTPHSVMKNKLIRVSKQKFAELTVDEPQRTEEFFTSRKYKCHPYQKPLKIPPTPQSDTSKSNNNIFRFNDKRKTFAVKRSQGEEESVRDHENLSSQKNRPAARNSHKKMTKNVMRIKEKKQKKQKLQKQQKQEKQSKEKQSIKKVLRKEEKGKEETQIKGWVHQHDDFSQFFPFS